MTRQQLFGFLLLLASFLFRSKAFAEHLFHDDDANASMMMTRTINRKVLSGTRSTRTLQDDACKDSPLRIKFYYPFRQKVVTRSCTWISNKKNRCNFIEGASQSCPFTCNTCSSSCTDSPNRFRISIKGKNRWRDCEWAKKKATVWRCSSAFQGIAETCRDTCNTCVSLQTQSPTPAPTSACGNSILEPDLGEECDDGIFNGEDWISYCSDSCTFVSHPNGCCLSDNQCFNDVKENVCPPGSFKPFGVCAEFSLSCPYNTPNESLCSSPDACKVDNVCEISTCNPNTDTCEYFTKSGYELINGECVALAECTTSSPPCPAGQTQSSDTCCELCPAATYELGGICIDCPKDTTSVEGSSGIGSCVELYQCPNPSYPPSLDPTHAPTLKTELPSTQPSSVPISVSLKPSPMPTPRPTLSPTSASSLKPSHMPTPIPTFLNEGDARLFNVCPDLCNNLNARRGNLKLVTWNVKNYHSDFNPGVVEGMVDAIDLLSDMSTLANIANVGAGLAQGAREAALELSRGIIDELGTGSLTDAAVQGALALEGIAARRNGLAIWIKLSGRCCKRRSCCVIFKRKEWDDVEKWHKCSAQPPAANQNGVDLLHGFFPNDINGINRALPGCIAEAARAFTC